MLTKKKIAKLSATDELWKRRYWHTWSPTRH